MDGSATIFLNQPYGIRQIHYSGHWLKLFHLQISPTL